MGASDLRREKYKYLFRKAIAGQISYTFFMLIAKQIFHRPWDYYDYVAGIAIGLIFGSMNWKEKERKL
ncbi:hypothetical protein PALU110988_14305 [Paenibacillus lupini]|uniref:hypothetical protein n=1 Tax=Paenibacillus lupini TaxID=1450204 RepID=UPI00141E4F55|nr:hypothetical protein [Paenibacillus lupini]NIK25064.1 hypothetical protein [Paenibacillus lupini]